MKLESLKSDKFTEFDQYTIDNPLLICGGREETTTYTNANGPNAGGSGPDHICYGADDHTGNPDYPAQIPYVGGGGDIRFNSPTGPIIQNPGNINITQSYSTPRGFLNSPDTPLSPSATNQVRMVEITKNN